MCFGAVRCVPKESSVFAARLLARVLCPRQLLKENGTLSSVVYGAMDQEARSIHLDKFRKGRVSGTFF